MRTEVVLGLGSNVDAEHNLQRAVARLASLLDVQAVSRVYESDPLGAHGTPRFLNAALRARTEATVDELKHGILRPLEAELGRRRGEDQNAPREIDIDVLLFGDLVVRDRGRELAIPDTALSGTAHVILPAAEVWPQGVHPELGLTLREIASRVHVPAGMRRRPDLDLSRHLGNNDR